MKLITTIIRPERLADVKAALFRAGVTGITVTRVTGPWYSSRRFGRHCDRREGGKAGGGTP